ncbi:unnamed protein product [Ixodes persulcatus]
MSLATPPPFLPAPGRPAIPWKQWRRVFQNYLLALGGDAHEPARRKALLLHCLGVEGQRVFYTLPETHPLLPGESVEVFVAELRDLSADCEFGLLADEFIRDQLVAKTTSQQLRERLLLEGSSLTLDRALSIGRLVEEAVRYSKELVSSSSVQKVDVKSPKTERPKRTQGEPSSSTSKKCYRCGSSGHLANSDYKCDSSAATTVPPFKNKKEMLCTTLETGTLIYNKIPQSLWSAVSIMSEDTYKRNFSSAYQLQGTSASLFDFSQQKIAVAGCFVAAVGYKERKASVRFYVVPNGTDILGIDAITCLSLEISGSALKCFNTTCVPSELPRNLVDDFAHLFDGTLGTAKGFTHKVKTRQGVQPVSAKLRKTSFFCQGRSLRRAQATSTGRRHRED